MGFMEILRSELREQISQQDWEKTPTSVKNLVEVLGERIEQLEQQVIQLQSLQQQLQEKVTRTSKN
jgi:transposase